MYRHLNVNDFLLFYLFTFLPFLIFPCKSFVNYLIYRNFAPDFHKTIVKTIDEARQKQSLPRE